MIKVIKTFFVAVVAVLFFVAGLGTVHAATSPVYIVMSNIPKDSADCQAYAYTGPALFVGLVAQYIIPNWCNTEAQVAADLCSQAGYTTVVTVPTLAHVWNKTVYSNLQCSKPDLNCSYTGPISWAPACSASGTWNTTSGSNATINNTAAGYTGSQTYSCLNGVYSYVSGSCSAIGTVSVSSNISSSWTITGPATITGSGTSQTSASQPTGTYTITWGAVAGYATPASQSFTLTPGGTISFSGAYSELSCTYTGLVGPWGVPVAACSATGTWNTTSGSNAVIGNAVAGYTGSITYSCSKGAYSYVSGSCTANTYNYTFNSNGGTPSYTTVNQASGTTVSSPGTPTRAGYTFTGWSPALPTTMPVGGGGSTAQWTLNSYTVSTSAGAGGTISPASRVVNSGNTTTFTVTPNAVYTASVTGCAGTLSGTTYTTGAITGACTVNATFSINSYTVSATAGAGGTISPASRVVSYGGTTTFTVTPNAVYTASVTGCAGTLSGTTYTTGAITGACTVNATFTATNTSTSPTIIINPTTYYPGVSNTYTFSATDIQNDQVRYGIDWNMDGAADEWLPAFPGYVNSGTSRSTNYTWPTTGNKQFQALTQDYQGSNSAWTVRNITVTDAPCANNTINPPACTQCGDNIAYVGGFCVFCNTGGCSGTGGNSTNSNSTLTCNSGGINIPNCTVCPGGQTLVGSMCVNNCTNGATNPTTCDACPAGQELIGGICTVTTSCGDSTCNGSENILTCPADCKVRYQQF